MYTSLLYVGEWLAWELTSSVFRQRIDISTPDGSNESYEFVSWQDERSKIGIYKKV
ncbi:MAG: hypothetical protein WC477_07610 [Patescibacteria group bacterium]